LRGAIRRRTGDTAESERRELGAIKKEFVMAETTVTNLIGITEGAAGEISRMLSQETGKTGLRLAVKKGCGCADLSYELGFDNAQANDHIIEEHGVKAFIDPDSMQYLQGLSLDFEGGLQGRGFVMKNPNAKKSCGCGKSFSV
jgi:iron-sulfur cluster assembly protein